MEEAFLTKSFYLFIDPAKKSFISFCYSRSDSILASKLRNTNSVALILISKGYNLSIIICPCNSIAIFKGIYTY